VNFRSELLRSRTYQIEKERVSTRFPSVPHPSVRNSRKTVWHCKNEVNSFIALAAFDLRVPPHFEPARTIVLPLRNQGIEFLHSLFVMSVDETGIDGIAAYVAVIPSIEFYDEVGETKAPER
jgi:hypothetical protein